MNEELKFSDYSLQCNSMDLVEFINPKSENSYEALISVEEAKLIVCFLNKFIKHYG